jgi:hypothetical protein
MEPNASTQKGDKMKLLAETVLYGMQIAAVFVLAGPVLVRVERQRTFSRNPAWVSTQMDFLNENQKVSMMPLTAGGIIMAICLALAAIIATPTALFVAHGPLFLFVLLGVLFYYRRIELRLRNIIPKDPLQRASLIPRSFFRYVSRGFTLTWVILALGILVINGYGVYAGAMLPKRALANVLFHVAVSTGILYGFKYTLKRQPYRISQATDDLARRFEFQMLLVAAYFITGIVLYYSVGSLGESPIFPLAPTVFHMWVEGAPFSYGHFFQDIQYRIVDYSATVLLIFLCAWTASHRFHKKVLAVDFRKAPNPPEV